MHQFMSCVTKDLGDALDVVDRDIALSSLQRAEKGAIQPDFHRQVFLRDPGIYPHETNVAGKDLAKRKRGRSGMRHPLDIRELMSLNPRCLGIISKVTYCFNV